MKKSVFIDTNVFLSLYNFSEDDLDKLEKLNHYLSKSCLNLCLTNQVRDEFFRNRESIISTALKKFQNEKFNFSTPIIARNFQEEYQELDKIKKKYEEKHYALCKRLKMLH
jgi:hypothetical protein